jgi:hypothetical protein
MKTGPNIVTTGLVFGYDTGEFPSGSLAFETFKPFSGNNRFYKGRSARNYIANQNAVRKFPLEAANYSSEGTFAEKHPNDIKAYDINGNRLQTYVNTGVTDYTNTYHAHWQHDPILNKPVVVMEDLVSGQWKAKSFGTGLPSWNTLGLTHGSKYTISWLQWVDNLSKHAKAGLYRRRASDNSNNFWDGQASSATSYNTKLRTWQRVYHTFTTNSVVDLDSTYLSIYMYGHYSPRATVKIADVQIDLHDHPTAYQEYNGSTTERSSTDGLVDVKGNTTINTSTVSFDSNGFPTFDGTDDYLTITGSTGITSDTKTIEIAFKMNGSYSNFSPLAVYANGSSSTNRIWLGLQNNKFRMHGWGTDDPDGTTTISADEWYICTFSYNKSTQAMKIYTNGVLESSTTNSQGGVTAASNMNWSIGTVPGGWQSVTYSNVDVSIFKIYNRILSDSEVKQNFNAYRKRFGI